MIKAVIFDFDGLLVDTEYLWYQIYCELLQENFGYSLSIETFNLGVGSSNGELFKYISEESGLTVDTEQIRENGARIFSEKSKNLGLMNGVYELLSILHSKGIRMVIATSSPYKRPTSILEKLGVLDMFEFIVSKEHVQHTKPSPDLFIQAFEKLGLPKEQVVILEDSVNGVIAANRAGIKVLAIPNSITKNSNFPSKTEIMRSILDVLDIIF